MESVESYRFQFVTRGNHMRADYIDEAGFWRLYSGLSEQYRLLCELMIATGIRVGDAVALRVDELSAARIVEQKTGKARDVCIPSQLCEKLLRHADGEFVFPSARSRSGHLARGSVARALKRERSGKREKRRVSPHACRKIYAVNRYRETGSLEAVQRDLQHANIATTILYCFSDQIAAEAEKKRAID